MMSVHAIAFHLFVVLFDHYLVCCENEFSVTPCPPARIQCTAEGRGRVVAALSGRAGVELPGSRSGEAGLTPYLAGRFADELERIPLFAVTEMDY